MQCLELVRQQIGDKILEAREIGNVGAVHLASGDFDRAVECHLEHLQIAVNAGNKVCFTLLFIYISFVYCIFFYLFKVEEARAYSNLGSSYHYKRNFDQANVYHNRFAFVYCLSFCLFTIYCCLYLDRVLSLAQELGDKSIEARAYAGLGHAARCIGNSLQAKVWHEKQLDMALATKDKV